MRQSAPRVAGLAAALLTSIALPARAQQGSIQISTAVQGVSGALRKLANSGTITAQTAVNMAGGDVFNGSSGNPGGLIQGNVGIAGASYILNYGAIIGGAFGIDGGAGTIINPDVGLIVGHSGIRSGATVVSNAGTIIGTAGYGVRLYGTAPALVTNTGTISGLSSSGITFIAEKVAPSAMCAAGVPLK
jgi:hypothetical protein